MVSINSRPRPAGAAMQGQQLSGWRQATLQHPLAAVLAWGLRPYGVAPQMQPILGSGEQGV
eukprot:6206356-Prymnesium_polylepis.4